LSFKDVKIGDKVPEVIRAIVEIPKGSKNKYELDLEMDVIFLNRVLYSPLQYPYDYGHIPETLADDGDALDILVISDEGTFPGCVLEARPIGVLDMEDEKGRDEKILAVSARDPRYHEIQDLKDLSPHRLLEIEHFFAVYKTLEDKKTSIIGWRQAAEAKKLVLKSFENYKRKSLQARLI
jgi:inorganic pyrophosphatase